MKLLVGIFDSMIAFPIHFMYQFNEGPVPFPAILVLSPKVESRLVFKGQFFILIPDLASDLAYVAKL